MIELLINKLKGYVCVELKGDALERFFNLANARGLHMWEIQRIDDISSFYINVKDVYRLKSILKKTKTRICIRERYGLPFFLFYNRKRKMLFLGLFSGWLIVYIMSLYVWNISFEGNTAHTDDELKKFVESLGVKEGMKQSVVEPEEIEKAIRNEFFDITWASVEVSGTMLRVHVRENSNYIDENEQNKENEMPADIVASRNAIVTSIVTRSGTPLVKEGAVVKVGDKLIEGKYTLYGDDLSVIAEHFVRADGDVVGKVVYDINEKIEREYDDKKYTGNEYEVNNIRFDGKNYEIALPWQITKFKLYDTITNGERKHIGENFYLPLYTGKTVYKEYEIKSEKYTDEQMEMLANEKIKYILKKIEKNTIQILDKNVKIEIGEEYCVISGQITVLEYIGSFGGTYE